MRIVIAEFGSIGVSYYCISLT